MPKHIEDTIFDESLPCNSRPVIDRLQELMDEAPTNDIKEAAEGDLRIRKCMWLLMAQYTHSTAQCDMSEEYEQLSQFNPNP